MSKKEELLLSILQEGTTSISNLLLTNYRKIDLSDLEMMLIIHLLYFQSKGNSFPSITELVRRMALSTEELMRLIQRLVRQGFIHIEEHFEEKTGKIFETYNLTPIFHKLIKEVERNYEIIEIEKEKVQSETTISNMFKIFEEEFGRPLSPMEIELINTWIDKDKYSDEIIIYALKEAVYVNKLNFRYIDRILFEWQKKSLKTIDQIKEHIKKFRSQHDLSRNTNPLKEKNTFEFYNWLENE